MTPRVLVVEDEHDLVTTLTYVLRKEGYTPLVATTAACALELANTRPPPDLILLDLMLPDGTGTEVCRELRATEKTKDIPVIMVTAKGEESDRVVGFEVGADDYIVKPFSVRELVLRVRAVLRRAHATASDDPVELGLLRVDHAAHKVFVDGSEVALTALEFKLLNTFVARRGCAQTRSTLLADVWGIRADITTRTVDTHVKRLREKLGDTGRLIETVRGVGYRFNPTSE